MQYHMRFDGDSMVDVDVDQKGIQPVIAAEQPTANCRPQSYGNCLWNYGDKSGLSCTNIDRTKLYTNRPCTIARSYAANLSRSRACCGPPRLEPGPSLGQPSGAPHVAPCGATMRGSDAGCYLLVVSYRWTVLSCVRDASGT